jgi:signal transduction histidine kinase/ActR/RegA family two-component response regulator
MLFALRQIESGLTERLRAGAQGVDLALGAIETGIRLRAQTAARVPSLERSLRSGDRLATLEWAERVCPLLGVDRSTVVDLDGRVVARGHLPASYGDFVASTSLETVSTGIHRGEGGLSIQASVPIRSSSEELIGSLRVEKAIDYLLLGELKRQFGLDFTVWDRDRLQAATFTTEQALEDARDAHRRASAGAGVQRAANYYYVRARLHAAADAEDAEILVSVAREPALELARQLTWLNGWALLAIIALTSAGAVVSAKGIVAPIQRLVQVTESAAGGRLDVPIDTKGNDEIAELATSFRRTLDRRSEVERELRETQAELERRVIARTEALRTSEEHLRQARQLDSLGRLAGGIAHDFNNVLTVILGNAEFVAQELERSVASRDASEAIKELKASAQHAATLTQQLLTFSRKQATEPTAIDLGRLLREVEGMLRRLTAENVALEVEVADDLAAIRADPAQMRQIVVNLVVNASDALPRGGTIRVSAVNSKIDSDVPDTAGLAPGDYVMLEVSDSGTGMDRATLERIYEPFFTTKPVGKGTGMGLAIVHGIVKQAGAHLTVESSPGVGTTFRIFFPALLERLREAKSDLRSIPVGHETLLLCEDEPSVRKLIASMLQSAGYDVLVADSGRTALSLSRDRSDVALVITDVVMPDMNGVELARALRERMPEVQILYLSGYTSDILDTRAELDKKDRLLEKPITREALLRAVRQSLDARTRPVSLPDVQKS